METPSISLASETVVELLHLRDRLTRALKGLDGNVIARDMLDRVEKEHVLNESRKRVPGVCDDAKRLGVSRQHLRSVLAGRRISRSLMDRYHALRRSKRRKEKAA